MSFEVRLVKFTLIIACLVYLCSAGRQQNDRPIIGIMSQEFNESVSYVAASYVKFVESGGARVVLIKINQPRDYYTKLFKSLNGLLIPGGGLPNARYSGYGKASKILFDLSTEAMKKNGDYFPIWGTCLGYQLLAQFVAKEYICIPVNAENLALPLELTSDFAESRIFDILTTPGHVFKALTTANTTFNHHLKGITPKNFTKFGLDKFFRVTSVNKDRNGLEFISTMEAYDYPIYGVQWHPEKNAFEWNTDVDSNIPHSSGAVAVTQHVANFIVNEARKSNHRFSSEEEASRYLVYHHQPTYTADADSNILPFEQTYFL